MLGRSHCGSLCIKNGNPPPAYDCVSSKFIKNISAPCDISRRLLDRIRRHNDNIEVHIIYHYIYHIHYTACNPLHTSTALSIRHCTDLVILKTLKIEIPLTRDGRSCHDGIRSDLKRNINYNRYIVSKTARLNSVQKRVEYGVSRSYTPWVYTVIAI